MEVITMESSAFKMLTEQIADVAKLVALIYSNARENTKRRSMELVPIALVMWMSLLIGSMRMVMFFV